MSRIVVTLPSESYAITIEAGILSRLGSLVAQVVKPGRAMLVVDEKITVSHGTIVAQSLENAGFQTEIVELTADESAKSLESVRKLYNAMLKARLERNSPVIALGGGVVGDVAGFAAATWLRGVPVIQVPTTLLAMVDASIGGKTGVNLPIPGAGAGAGEALEMGKNLVGAFWQPKAVVIDPLTLMTLEARDFRCGLGECVKHCIIAEAPLLEFIEEHQQAILGMDQKVLGELIERSASVKARIVGDDEREAGQRALLNLGHTFAHAIEPIKELDLRHGEAVSIGLCAAMQCSVLTDRIEEEALVKIRDLLERLKLPVKMSSPISTERLIRAMGFDKKVQSGRLRLVLPTSIGSAELVDDLDDSVIRQAWAAVGAG